MLLQSTGWLKNRVVDTDNQFLKEVSTRPLTWVLFAKKFGTQNGVGINDTEDEETVSTYTLEMGSDD